MIKLSSYIIILFSFFCNYVSNSQVVINEIQAAPIDPEPEWIELYNFSQVTYVFNNFMIQDEVTTKNLPEFTIDPYCFVILTKDSALLSQKRTIPLNAKVINCSLPTLNNTFDVVVLKNSDSIVVDSVYYDFNWGKKGVSFERIDWSKPALSEINLSPSVSADSATAGYINSIAIQDFDVSIENIYEDIISDQVNIIVRNRGRNDINVTTNFIYIDKSKDNKFSDDELIYKQSFDNLNIEDSILIKLSKNDVNNLISGRGYFNMIAFINSDSDVKYSNDTTKGIIYISYPQKSILINEFMYDVSPDHAEYIELWNQSSDSIDLNGWYIRDLAADEQDEYLRIDKVHYFISPSSFCIITWDSLIFEQFPELIDLPNLYLKKSALNLNMNSDDIVLIDPVYITIDSLRYDNSWHNNSFLITKDRSLEKINYDLNSTNALSWSTCVDTRGGTPGSVNSIFQENDQTNKLTADPNPFSPYSSGNDKVCMISYSLPFQQSFLNALIFDIHGIMVREILNSEIVSFNGSFIWDGKNEDGFELPVGPYILFIEASDNFSDEVYTEKLMIVIGKK